MPNQYNFISSDIINNQCDYITVTSNNSTIVGTRTFVNNVSFGIRDEMIKELRALNTMFKDVLKTKCISTDKLIYLIKTGESILDKVFNDMDICPTLSKEQMEKYEPIIDGDEFNE